jgi:hypothetical protein
MYHNNYDNGENDNKLQTALMLVVALKNGPEHGIHIVALLCRGKWQRNSWSAELCVKKRTVH